MPSSVCPCFFGSRVSESDSAELADRDPVVLVSGMGGSILNSKSKNSIFGFQTRVWVRIFLADLQFKNKLWSLYNPTTGYTEELDKNSEIVVPDDDHGLYAIDILDPSLFVKCVHLTEVYHFHDMINMLVECGYEKGTTLFGYGYDFRQSNRIDKLMEGLKVKLETAYKASGGRQINLISHSMGGILVKCFMALYPDIFSKYVNKWICIACPFEGAPGYINDALLTGLQFIEGFESYFFVGRWTMHQLVTECPSVYEMLPNPEFEWKEVPKICVWRKGSPDEDESSPAKFESYGPLESISLFEEALRDNELNYNGKMVALPFNKAILKCAAGTRHLLDKAKMPEGVSFYNIYGTSFDTPFDVCYGSETYPIDDLSEICHTLPEYSYVDGDETVPAESAQLHNL
ncbi:phospholipase A(1) LCAT3 isoform X2 [Beta vulgaris subsp. vulgaris]|uniref:phospholipase A(1) LCAT3 isoform X2 n=1 Tax=Beta vulgaris subsp. vulgaris TaxID=3555 RepID=UPI0020373A32|nr:phospholipase A(1) LCAT3 isoform X2 [Beta vulgaris subsp. vulgaris]